MRALLAAYVPSRRHAPRVAVVAVTLALGLVPAAQAGTLDQQQTDASAGLALIGSDDTKGQTFTAGLTGELDQADLFLAKSGSNTETLPLFVEIRTVDASGAPTATVLAATSVPAADVQPIPFEEFVPVAFSPGAQVQAGTQYALVAHVAGTSARYFWGRAGGDAYPGGAKYNFARSTWSTEGIVDDHAFRTYVATPPNQPPSVLGDSYSTGEDRPLSVAAPGVLGNDTDPDEDALTASLVSGPAHGTLTLSADGSFSYIPDGDYNGPDSFTYKANDGSLDSDAATVSLTVSAVNDAPTVTVAAGGSCGGNDRSGTINLTVADTEQPASTLTLTLVSSNQALVPSGGPFGGSGAARTLTATALPGRTGSTLLLVTVSDGTAAGSVTVTLRAGGNGNDTLTGTAGADILLGQNGDDMLSGLGGIDLLCGARGNDRLTGGANADHFGGGAGTDTATDLTTAQGDTQDATIP